MFDESGITSRGLEHLSHPELATFRRSKLLLLNKSESRQYGGGSEAATRLAAPSIAGRALHDATGKVMRRLPLKRRLRAGAFEDVTEVSAVDALFVWGR